MERNKIFGAILAALFVMTLARVVGDHMIHPTMPVVNAYPVDTLPPLLDGPGADGAQEVPTLSVLLAAANIDKGARLARKCTPCHALNKDGKAKVGPPLWNIVGADKAAYPGFSYSAALQALDGVWDEEALNAFVTSPKTYAPGTRMVFKGIADASQRADLIAYLGSLRDDPPPADGS